MRLLFVCTGNICRSPLAERLAGVWAEESLGAGAATVHIASAGTDALDGKGMDSRSAAVLVEMGGDSAGFFARTVTPEMAYDADLVLTMTRRQRRLLLAEAPRALRHTFTLPEATDLLRMADLRGVADLPLHTRARELAVRLNAGRARRSAVASDDVADPFRQSGTVHRQVGARIARKLRPLADVLFVDHGVNDTRVPTRHGVYVRPDLPQLVRPTV